jgi:hypothetical protein
MSQKLISQKLSENKSNATVENTTIQDNDEDNTLCDYCGNRIESCMCACPYCGEKDACECCLYDAVTGGG